MTTQAARLVLSGGVIVYPTETVYGIGASALVEDAVRKVSRIKRRPPSMPLSVAVSSFKMMEAVAEIDANDLDLLEKLLPGPVTVLVKKRRCIPDLVTSGSPLVGIRYPDHELALELIEMTGPITSTSANVTGSLPPTSVGELDPMIRDAVDLVLDGGRCRFARSSTIVDLGTRKIIRVGAGFEIVQTVMR